MLRPFSNLTGNARYEGFCIDLLRHIALMVGFDYRIELVPDGKYGVYDLESGEWNGIVRQLMDKVFIQNIWYFFRLEKAIIQMNWNEKKFQYMFFMMLKQRIFFWKYMHLRVAYFKFYRVPIYDVLSIKSEITLLICTFFSTWGIFTTKE